mgnify:CR=1 FL=1|tara:strand:+ start:459 stop:695 length:237 start_codon:yes stop_codon:yes gene_type:complete
MIKHISTQPLHTTLKQYRVLAISSVCFLGYMLVRVWAFYEEAHNELSTESAAAFFAYVAALLGAFVKCINNTQAKQED